MYPNYITSLLVSLHSLVHSLGCGANTRLSDNARALLRVEHVEVGPHEVV